MYQNLQMIKMDIERLRDLILIRDLGIMPAVFIPI